MRIEILTEAEDKKDFKAANLKPILFDLGFRTSDPDYHIGSAFSLETAQEYVKSLKFSEVSENCYPSLLRFYEAVQEGDYVKFVDYAYKIHDIIRNILTRASELFGEILNIKPEYRTIAYKILEFNNKKNSPSHATLRKVGAIYDRFHTSQPELFKNMFELYERYIDSLTGADKVKNVKFGDDIAKYETKASLGIRKSIQSYYLRNKDKIEEILNEIGNISTNLFSDYAPFDDLNNAETLLAKTEFRDLKEIEKFCVKSIYLFYLDSEVRKSVGGYYDPHDVNRFEKFRTKSNKDNILNKLREALGGFEGEIETVSHNELSAFNFKKFSSADFTRFKDFHVQGDVLYTIIFRDFIDTSKASNLPTLAFIQKYDSLKDTKIFETMIRELYIEVGSPRKMLNAVLNYEMKPSTMKSTAFNLSYSGDLSYYTQDMPMVYSYDKAKSYLQIVVEFMNTDVEEFKIYASKYLKSFFENEGAGSLEDVIAKIREGEVINADEYRLVKSEASEKPIADNISYAIASSIAERVIDNGDTDAFTRKVFIELASKSQEVLLNLYFGNNRDVGEIKKLLDYLYDFSYIFESECENIIKNAVNSACQTALNYDINILRRNQNFNDNVDQIVQFFLDSNIEIPELLKKLKDELEGASDDIA